MRLLGMARAGRRRIEDYHHVDHAIRVKGIHCPRTLPSALIRLSSPSDLAVVANGAGVKGQERIAL
jgi:hypothetical protein